MRLLQPIMRCMPLVSAVMISFAVDSARASLIAYDGFESGGVSPGAGQYGTGGGFANDNLNGQGPVTTGFDGTAPWTSPSGGLVNGVYFQASATPLNYTSGSLQLDTRPGSVRFLDTFSSFDKSVARNITNKPVPGEEAWYSVLLRYESTATWNSTMDFRLLQGGRDLSLGITAGGDLRAFTSGSTTTFNKTVAALTPGVDHLVLFHMENNIAGGGDRIEIWLDPDLSSLGAADFTETDTFLFVGSNSSFRFDSIQIDADIAQNGVDQFFFDEFRLGDTLADVLPTVAAIPEPSSILALLGLGGICLFRRSRRRN